MNPISAVPENISFEAALQGRAPGQKPDKLRASCEEAEGLFASLLLKEGLKPMFEEASQSGSHMGGLLEATVEQMARDLGHQGSLGIADSFYDQLSGNLVTHSAPATRQGEL